MRAALTAEALASSSGAKRAGGGWLMRCPAHDDAEASLSFKAGDKVPLVVRCHAGCSAADILSALRDRYGEPEPEPTRNAKAKTPRQLVATYEYRDESGALLYRKRRFQPKAFIQDRPDGAGGFVPQLAGVRPVLYRLPELIASDPADVVLFVEGEKDADALAASGFTATTSGGSTSWKPEFAECLAGRDVVIIPDADDAGRRHASEVLSALLPVARRVRVMELPGAKDAAEWLGAGGSAGALLALIDATPAKTETALADVLALCRQTMHEPDEDAICVVLAAVAAGMLPGAEDWPPVWVCLIGQASGGKTELLHMLGLLPRTFAVSTVTEAALLSGTPSKDKTKDAAGGLLAEIGASGTLVCKDFGSILSMHADARAAVLAMFREIYDGAVTRRVGSDGGRKLEWQGKLVLLAAATGAIDAHANAISSLGERWLTYRLKVAKSTAGEEHGGGAMTLTFGGSAGWRRKIQEAVAALFASFRPAAVPAVSVDDDRRLVQVCAVVAEARAAVLRAGYSREIELVGDPESPARLAVQLGVLWRGMLALGVSRDDAWRICRKIAADGVPAIRKAVLSWLASQDEGTWHDTKRIREGVALHVATVRRTLEELEAQGIVACDTTEAGKAAKWKMAPAFRERWLTHLAALPDRNRKIVVDV